MRDDRRRGKTGTWKTSLSFVYADRLGTPRVIVRNTDQAIQWRWDTAEPFGATPPSENPAGLGAFGFSQRFPGQVFDSETGNFYNWHRDYGARLGRHLQSDLIGLVGGINTYAYVAGEPLGFVDRDGLQVRRRGTSGPNGISQLDCDIARQISDELASAGRGAGNLWEICKDKLKGLRDRMFGNGERESSPPGAGDEGSWAQATRGLMMSQKSKLESEGEAACYYSIRLLITHPVLSVSEVTNELDMEPDYSWNAGDRKFTSDMMWGRTSWTDLIRDMAQPRIAANVCGSVVQAT